MDFEPSDHEPDEYDPEAELRDPDSDGPTIPEAPSVSTAEADAPGELRAAFWIVVAVVNAAVLALSLGAMLVVFRGDLTRGGALLAGGVVLSGLAYRRYRTDLVTAVAREAADDADDPEAETVSGVEAEPTSPEGTPPDDEDRT